MKHVYDAFSNMSATKHAWQSNVPVCTFALVTHYYVPENNSLLQHKIKGTMTQNVCEHKQWCRRMHTYICWGWTPSSTHVARSRIHLPFEANHIHKCCTSKQFFSKLRVSATPFNFRCSIFSTSQTIFYSTFSCEMKGQQIATHCNAAQQHQNEMSCLHL